jgi:hypothetical protein
MFNVIIIIILSFLSLPSYFYTFILFKKILGLEIPLYLACISSLLLLLLVTFLMLLTASD